MSDQDWWLTSFVPFVAVCKRYGQDLQARSVRFAIHASQSSEKARPPFGSEGADWSFWYYPDIYINTHWERAHLAQIFEIAFVMI